MSKQQGTSGRPRGPMNAPSNVTAAAVAAAAGKCQIFYKGSGYRYGPVSLDYDSRGTVPYL